MDKKIVFDLETKKTFDEVGGYTNNHLLGVTVCGVYEYVTGKYRAYKESELGEMEKLFSQADLLIGFNSKSFDNVVLQPYFTNLDLSGVPHLDILEETVKVLGHRLKLESVAQSTLYEGKSGSGLDAIRYYREGDWDSLIKYCLDDVRVTKEVYEYGLRHGRLWYQNSGQLTPYEISWGTRPTIIEQLAHALERHQQIKIVYIKIGSTGTSREERIIDLRAMDEIKFRAYDHTLKEERIFTIAKVFDVELVGEMDSYQPSLV